MGAAVYLVLVLGSKNEPGLGDVHGITNADPNMENPEKAGKIDLNTKDHTNKDKLTKGDVMRDEGSRNATQDRVGQVQKNVTWKDVSKEKAWIEVKSKKSRQNKKKVD